MSGWGDLTSFAKSAISTAQKVQKKIDRVLDIKDPTGSAAADEPLAHLKEDFFTAFGLSTSRSETEISPTEGDVKAEGAETPSSSASIFNDVTAKLKFSNVTANSPWASWLPSADQTTSESTTNPTTEGVSEEQQLEGLGSRKQSGLNTPSDSVLELIDEKDLQMTSDSLLNVNFLPEEESSAGWASDGWNTAELTASSIVEPKGDGAEMSSSFPTTADSQWNDVGFNPQSDDVVATEDEMLKSVESSNLSFTPLLSTSSALLSSSSFSSDISGSTTVVFSQSDQLANEDKSDEDLKTDDKNSCPSPVVVAEQPDNLPSEGCEGGEIRQRGDPEIVDVEVLLRGVVERVEDLQKCSQTVGGSRELKIVLPTTTTTISSSIPPESATPPLAPDIILPDDKMTVDCSANQLKCSDEFAISPTSSHDGEGSPPVEVSDDSSAGRNEGSGSTADFDVQKDSGSTGFTSPMEEVDLASDIEILSRCTTTPNGSEYGSIRSGFVFTPASVSLPSATGGPEDLDSTSPASLSPLKRHLASIQLALGSQQQSSERTKKHRRVSSDQATGKESLRTVLSGVPMEATANETIDKLSKCLSAREQKLLAVSQENAKLTEENDKLRRDLELLKAQNSLGGITDLEAKYVNLCEEKEALKRKCDSLQKELVTRVSSQQFQHMMKEKEEQIQQLMEEGQKLSKKEFQQASVIKKLREKEKEAEKLLEAQKAKLKEMEDLRAKWTDGQQQLAQYEDLVAKMEGAAERSAKQTTRLQAELLENGEKLSSYKGTLERCYKEIAELHKDKVARQAEMEELRRQTESSEREEMRMALERSAAERDGERMRLAQQLDGLRLSLTQTAQDHSRKEDALRWEIGRLQKQLQEADSRNESLSESATAATKPLLRQIESLQSSFKTQQDNWERLEKSLYDRITEAEAKANLAAQTEKSAVADVVDLRTRLRTNEAQISSLTLAVTEKTRMVVELKREVEKLWEDNKRLERELETERSLQRQAVTELKKEKELLNAQMEFDTVQTRSQFEMKLKDLQIALDEKEKLLSSARSQLLDQQLTYQSNRPLTSALHIVTSTPSLLGAADEPPHLSRFDSVADDSAEDIWRTSELTGSSFSTLLENMRAKLQQRDSDVNNLRSEVKRLLSGRDQLTGQLTTLSSQVQILEGQQEEFQSLQVEFKQLSTSHQALLQLYGEKVEQNEELRMDLEDVKVMYRQQIEDLLAKVSG